MLKSPENITPKTNYEIKQSVALTCAVDQDIQSAKLFVDSGFDVDQVLVGGQLSHDGDRLRRILLGYAIHLCQVLAHHGHLGAIVEVPVGQTATNPARGSRYHDYFEKEEAFLFDFGPVMLRLATRSPLLDDKTIF